MEFSIARSQWKLASILQDRHGGSNEEIEGLRKASIEYVTLSQNHHVPSDTQAAETLFDSLVIFWSR